MDASEVYMKGAGSIAAIGEHERRIELATLSPHQSSARTSVLIAVPLYRGAALIEGLFRALADLGQEIASIGGRIVLINDSPGDEDLKAALALELPRLCEAVSVELLTNAVNLGFVRTANRALRLGLASGADVILLNSDTLPTVGAFAEMVAVALSDPMISVVSPRSNNATICNSPYPDTFRKLGPRDALRAHQAIAPYLPRVTYVPTAVGFCLYVRRLMIEEFGFFDEIYGEGYNEENDFIMRCNRCGYRAVLANRAFVYHIGEASFKTTKSPRKARELLNRSILLNRYPYYDRAVRRYFLGTEYRTQRLLAGLVPDGKGRLRILLDGRNVGAFHNGTYEHTRELIRAFARAYGEEFSIYLACSSRVATFHGFDKIEGLTLCDGEDIAEQPFAVAFRIAQPFWLEHLRELGSAAPVTGFLFLDSIAMDCQALDTEDYGRVWNWMIQTISLIGFNSDFTAQQFKRRFKIPPKVVNFVSLCSTDVTEYGPGVSLKRSEGYILVVGNHYPHKHVEQTVELLKASTSRRIVALGPARTNADPKATFYRAGELEQAQVDSLYDGAELVVFPSHYEGFGLPIMHALARGKPVIARESPVSREIKASCDEGVNLHLHTTTAEIVAAASAGEVWRAPAGDLKPQTWATAAEAVRSAILEAVSRCEFSDVHARILRLEACDRDLRDPQDEGDIEAGASRPHPAQRRLQTVVSPRELERRAEFLALLASPDSGSELALLAASRGEPHTTYLASAGLQRVRMSIKDLSLSDVALTHQMLDLAETLPKDGLLVLDAAAGEIDPSRLRVLLIGAGFTPGHAEEEDGRLRVVADLFIRWSESVSLEGDGEDFIKGAYLAVLGRPSDPEGLRSYVAELEKGAERRDLLKAFYMSAERLQSVAELHGYTLSPPSSQA